MVGDDDELGGTLLIIVPELRNRIYGYCLSGVGLSTALGLGNACRTTRSEYMPLYFGSVRTRIHFVLVEHFLRTFYSDTSAFAPLPACKLLVGLSRDHGWGPNTSIDLKWVGEYLRGHPKAEVLIENRPISLFEAIDYVPSLLGFCLWLKDMDALTLCAQPVSCHAPSGVRRHAMDWVLTLVMKPEAARRIRCCNRNRVDYFGGILTRLRLRGGIDGERISSLEFRVSGGGEDWQVKMAI